jgi:hypothetical protein
MIRGALLSGSLALFTLLGIPDIGFANESAVEESEGRAHWRERLLVAHREVAVAKKRNSSALKAYEMMRHRRRPRGDAKQAIIDELELSREALAKAQHSLTQLEDAAQRAGLTPKSMEFTRDQINAAAAAPASSEP